MSTTVTSRIIRRDFLNDYGPALRENGFVKVKNTFYRVQNDILLYVGVSFFSSQWTVTYAAHPFVFGYTDMKGYDGARLTDLARRLSSDRDGFFQRLADDHDPENYEYLRRECRAVFFDTVFPRFNTVASIDALIEYKIWDAQLTRFPTDFEGLAMACFQGRDYARGAEYLRAYLDKHRSSYEKRLPAQRGHFEEKFELFTGFREELNSGRTGSIDAYVAENMAITANTCAELKLIAPR